MKVAVIDNENQIRQGLVEMLQLLSVPKDCIFEADGVKSGMELISRINPDIVLLDVEMNDGTGFDLLNSLNDYNFELIFITAHDKYAMRAFQFSAIHFLQKPIDPIELSEAIERAKESKSQSDLSKQIQVLQKQIHQLSDDSKIVLKDLKAIYFVKIKEILHCEASGSYTIFHLLNGEKLTISKPLKEYELLLEEFGFLRTHHSHLVNVSAISRIDKTEGGCVVLSNGDLVPVSQRKWDQILKKLEP